MTCTRVHQGQRYAFGQHEYLALENGTRTVKEWGVTA